MNSPQKIIAVFGASGNQGGSVVRALQLDGKFKTRAVTRNPGKYTGLADEVVTADLNRPETLEAALEGVHGVFLVTNFWEEGTDEIRQATNAIKAAKNAGVNHFIWSTLPNVEEISGGKFNVPHFTGKAKIDRIVREANFPNHTYVIAPFYYHNFIAFAPQKLPDGSLGWAFPIDPSVRCIHMGDIQEIGNVVVGAFSHPDQVGSGEYLPLVGDFMSFNEIKDTLNRQGHSLSFMQVPKETFAGFPGAVEFAESLAYFQAHTYLGSNFDEQIRRANMIAGKLPTKLSEWSKINLPFEGN